MRSRLLKTGWHLLLAGAGAYEYSQAKTPFRRLLLGACIGWHVAAAHDDWVNP